MRIIYAHEKASLEIPQRLPSSQAREVVSEKIRRWQEDAREAIESHNRFIAEHGIWSEKYRDW